MMVSNIAKDRTAHSLKKRGSVSPLSGHEFQQRELHGHIKDCVSTVSHMDVPSQRDDTSRLTVQVENTYQLGPAKHFPVVTVNHILKDVLTNYLQEEQYEPELCRQMTKTISEGRMHVKLVKSCIKFTVTMLYKNVSANDGSQNSTLLISMTLLGQGGPPRWMMTK
ncbi:dynein light chain Tctex-type 5 isoform 1-T1 [Hipposideros larvatus]